MTYQYNCLKCEYFTNDKSNYTRHMKSSKHVKKMKGEDIYICKKCSYKTIKKQDYDKHCKTKKCCKQIREKPSLKIAAIYQQNDYMSEMIDLKESEMEQIENENRMLFGLLRGEITSLTDEVYEYPLEWEALYDEVDVLATSYYKNLKLIRLWNKKMNKLFPTYIDGLLKFWKECTINKESLYVLD